MHSDKTKVHLDIHNRKEIPRKGNYFPMYIILFHVSIETDDSDDVLGNQILTCK
jgi:hypothetical protein